MTALRFAALGWVVNVALAAWHYYVSDMQYVESLPEAERPAARFHCKLGQLSFCVVPWFNFALNLFILVWVVWRLFRGPCEDSEDSAL